MKKIFRPALACLALALLCPARAASPFEVTAVSTVPAFSHTQGYGSFPDLVSDVIQNQGNFSPLQTSSSFFADITFLGVSNALQFNYNEGVPGPNFVNVSIALRLPETCFAGGGLSSWA